MNLTLIPVTLDTVVEKLKNTKSSGFPKSFRKVQLNISSRFLKEKYTLIPRSEKNIVYFSGIRMEKKYYQETTLIRIPSPHNQSCTKAKQLLG